MRIVLKIFQILSAEHHWLAGGRYLAERVFKLPDEFISNENDFGGTLPKNLSVATRRIVRIKRQIRTTSLEGS